MVDTARTRSAHLVLAADNTTGQYSLQDLRDFMVTVMPEEFANADDFWNRPLGDEISDGQIRGWKLYSQIIDSACSFGNVLVMTPSGTWRLGTASDSDLNKLLALAGNTYAAGESQATVLREGLLCKSAFSNAFDSKIGAYVYLMSGGGEGSMSVTITTNSVRIIGYVEPQGVGGSVGGVVRFNPDSWAVAGT